MSANFITIFLPREILQNLSHKYLFGYCNKVSFKYVINCTVSVETCKTHSNRRNFQKEFNERKQIETSSLPYEFQYLGIIYSSKRKKKFSSYKQLNEDNPVWFILRVDFTTNMFYIEKLSLNMVIQEYSVNFVLYDNKLLVNSDLLVHSNDSVGQKHFLTFLIKTLKCPQKSSIMPINPGDKVANFSHSSSKRYCFHLIDFLFSFLEIVLQWCIFFSSLRFCSSILKIINWSHVGRQFYQRFLHIRDICLNWRTKETIGIRSRNLICAFLFDIFCGWLIVFLIVKSNPLVFLLDYTVNQVNTLKLLIRYKIDYRECSGPDAFRSSDHLILKWQYTNKFPKLLLKNIVNGLQKIIYWLMGVPVGLKLNIPLNSALGHFFLYHIYLWEAYIAIVLPVFSFLLKISTIIGIIGFTFFLSLLSDLVSLATVHIYCFYGYATRLYGYQISCLFALWRLFRGKKWNPLRQRVDSYSYDIHQLYLGTLFFTVLLFLLPTVLVYYFVFTCLRIVVLIIQGILVKITEVISILPLYSLFSRVLNSSETVGDVYFTVFSSKASLVLSMEAVQSSFTSVMKNTLPELHKYDGNMSWKDLLSSILWGEIIYPI